MSEQTSETSISFTDLKLNKDVNLRKIAQQTVCFSGADLANVCNEAALLAARKDKESIGMNEFYAAVERVTMGPEKKSNTTSDKEKKIVAYHEAGHALLSMLVDETDTFKFIKETTTKYYSSVKKRHADRKVENEKKKVLETKGSVVGDTPADMTYSEEHP